MIRRGRERRVAAVILAAAVVLAGNVVACGPSGTPSAPSGRLMVITTTTVFADIVKGVGGDRVDVHSIIPAGVGPEDFEPRPDDARALDGAALIVSNGVGLDDFLDDLLSANAGVTAPRLVLGDGIPAIDVAGEPNPHFWLDPSLVVTYYLPAIARALTAIDPAGAADYETHRTAYADAITALDGELQAQVATLPAASRKLVTFHDAFPYFARHFGFELIGIVVANPGQEASAGEIVSLIKTIRAAGVHAIFGESQSNPSLAETVAQESGVARVVTTMYNDALGPSPADTYVGLLRWDMDQITAALR